MGVFQVPIAIRRIGGGEWREITAVVDTGSTLTKIPRSLAEELGLEAVWKAKSRLADGYEVERDVAIAEIRCEAKVMAVPVTIGEEDVPPLLGATALEILGFTVDPINQVLVPADHVEYAEAAG